MAMVTPSHAPAAAPSPTRQTLNNNKDNISITLNINNSRHHHHHYTAAAPVPAAASPPPVQTAAFYVPSPSPPPNCQLLPSALCARRRVSPVAPLDTPPTTFALADCTPEQQQQQQQQQQQHQQRSVGFAGGRLRKSPAAPAAPVNKTSNTPSHIPSTTSTSKSLLFYSSSTVLQQPVAAPSQNRELPASSSAVDAKGTRHRILVDKNIDHNVPPASRPTLLKSPRPLSQLSLGTTRAATAIAPPPPPRANTHPPRAPPFLPRDSESPNTSKPLPRLPHEPSSARSRSSTFGAPSPKQSSSHPSPHTPSSPSSFHTLSPKSTTPSSVRAAAASIIQDHRPPPQPPAIHPPLNLVAALLGEPIQGLHPPPDQPRSHRQHNGTTGRKSSGQKSRPSRQPIPPQLPFTPPNMPANIYDIVSRCEDASMSWSLQFWVTIADPLTNHVFFACPASGQCSWEPPVGAFVVPRSPDGEWWELADPSRDNQSYYYNTLTGVTQWERPGPDTFVIPLGLIQRNALPASKTQATVAVPAANAAVATSSDTTTTAAAENDPRSTSTSSPSAVRFAAAATNNTNPPPPSSPSTSINSPNNTIDLSPLGLAQSATASSSGPLTPIPDMSPSPDAPQATEVLDSAPPSPDLDHHPSSSSSSWWERRKARPKAQRNGGTGSSPRSAGKGRSVEISPVLGHPEGATMFNTPPTSPIPVEEHLPMQDSLSTSAVNLVFQPSSPTSANYELHNFSTEDFADRYFATKRSGVLRQRLSLERIMEWQRNPITSPLLVLTKASIQDSLTTFKVIQHVMGERDRPVDSARQTLGLPPTTSVLSLRLQPRDDRDEKTVILEEIRWMIQLGVGRVEMRDELYCQLIKQLTRNPDKDATVLGFQLMCVFVAAFGPSKSFEPFVRSFLVANIERSDFGIGIMSKFCLTRLDTWGQKGGRGRVLTIVEIEHASDAAFYPSVYGQTLETIMQRQEGAYPELRIPIILPFLADGILALGGTESEGIFRVPGDNDVIAHLKTRIDRGQYQLDGVEDPHVVASLFKLWLRELEEPLVPSSLYNGALQASKSVDLTILFIKKLPDHNRRVLLFVISFMQLFLDPTVIAITKMTSQNLALILAPNILRTSSESLVTVFANSSFESQFVLNLLLHLDPPTIDPEYVPMHGQRGALGERPSFDSAMSSEEHLSVENGNDSA